MTRRRWLVISVISLAAVLLAGRVVAGWYVDYRWYEGLGAADVWRARAMDLLLLRGGAFTAGTLFVFVNLFAVRHSVLSVVFPRRVGNIEIREEISGRLLLGAVVFLSVALGFLLAVPHGDWTSVELIRHGQLFRESDPYFQEDLAFWLYWLPLEMSFQVWALILMLAVTLIVVFLYALTPSLRWEGGRLRVSGYVRRHFFALSAVFLLLLAWSYRVDAFRLLLEGSGPGGAFVAMDHRFGIPTYLVLAFVTLVAAMLIAWAGWWGQVRLAVACGAGVALLALSLRQVVPPIASRLLSASEVEVRDRPYLATRAGFSRRAYDIDRVRVPDRSDSLVREASRALQGVPIWDPPVVESALTGARLGGRPSGGLGWAVVDRRLRAVSVERPTGPESADPLAPWAATMVGADVSSESGGPVVGELDSGMASRLPAAVVAESLPGYAVVIDTAGGVGGTALDRWVVRLAHAWALQNPSLLTATVSPAATRAVLYRDLRARIGRLFPAFVQDRRAAPVVVGDTILWAVHLYAASGSYPLSEPVVQGDADVRYLRHAGVAMVNSHSGRAWVISDPEPDPLTQAWKRRFPTLFVEIESVPEDVLRRIPPPTDAVLAQARILARYGRRGEVAPAGRLIRHHGGDTLFAFPAWTPYADVVSERLNVALPIIDPGDRVRGLYVSAGGAEFRPTYEDALAKPRWALVLERLKRSLDTTTIGGPRPAEAAVVRGPVRVVPAGDSIAYVQSAYLWRRSATPALYAVGVLRGDSIRLGRSLLSAAGLPEPELPPGPMTPETFRARAASLHAQMRQALSRGDWSAFGLAFEALGRLLRGEVTPP